LVSLLDALAKYANPGIRGNRKRFIKLIDDYSNWPFRDHISIPQLDLLIAFNCLSNECKELKGFLKSRLAKWPPSQIVRPESDIEKCKLSKLCRQYGCAEKVIHKCIEQCRYPSLLYKLRNYAVHEMRAPGEGIQLSNDNSTPYYHGMINSNTWELVIPTEVIISIIESSAGSLKQEFLKKDVNPYKRLPLKSVW
jgi:hypothetical protein